MAGACFQHSVSASARRTPGAVAVVEPGRGSISYGDLDLLSDRLRDRPGGPGLRLPRRRPGVLVVCPYAGLRGAGLEARHRVAEAALAGRLVPRRDGRRARHHRARFRLRHLCDAPARRARRRRLAPERQQDLHLQRSRSRSGRGSRDHGCRQALSRRSDGLHHRARHAGLQRGSAVRQDGFAHLSGGRADLRWRLCGRRCGARAEPASNLARRSASSRPTLTRWPISRSSSKRHGGYGLMEEYGVERVRRDAVGSSRAWKAA